jgi:hypothetical protein
MLFLIKHINKVGSRKEAAKPRNQAQCLIFFPFALVSVLIEVSSGRFTSRRSIPGLFVNQKDPIHGEHTWLVARRFSRYLPCLKHVLFRCSHVQMMNRTFIFGL